MAWMKGLYRTPVLFADHDAAHPAGRKTLQPGEEISGLGGFRATADRPETGLPGAYEPFGTKPA